MPDVSATPNAMLWFAFFLGVALGFVGGYVYRRHAKG